MKKLKGLIGAPHTPMNDDLSINFDAIEKQAELYAKNNIKGAYICGSTGEGMSMTLQERMNVAQCWLEATKDADIDVLVNIGHTCLADCRTLASHAQEHGAFAISAMPPCYYKPESLEMLVDFYSQITLAASKTAFYAYHIPGMTGVNFPMTDFIKVASEAIPTLAGVKFNSSDFMDYANCRDISGDKFDIMYSCDEHLLASLPYGTEAAIGSTYNYIPKVYTNIIEAFNEGNYAKATEYQMLSIKIINILKKYDVLALSKALMQFTGVDCGCVRPPVKNVTPEIVKKACKELETVNFFDYLARL